ncbi:MAG: MDR/zinc-dependent alcohol dehydrogenase-like family protein [Planctomycetota bacterium]|jgi:threonine dehydrogenase-like Zn-dependent dehydrogenase
MKALVFENGELSFRDDYPVPARSPGEALIRVSVAGLCNTDIEIIRGYMDFSGVPGHEFTGVVEEADNRDLIGKRIVGEINCPCGDCDLCREGLGRHCRSRTVLGIMGRDGAFAEYTTLPEANLHVIPDSMSDETGVFVEPAAAAFAILEQVEPAPTDRCLVMGDGKLGLLVAQVLAPGCHVKLLGRSVRKLSIAKQFGIPAEVAGKMTERDFDIVVDATGTRSGFDGALALVKPRGTLVLKTTLSGDIPIALWRIVVDEINLVGSRCGLFEPALEALKSGVLRVEPLISAKYALEDFREAFDKSKTHGIVKVLLYPQGLP